MHRMEFHRPIAAAADSRASACLSEGRAQVDIIVFSNTFHEGEGDVAQGDAGRLGRMVNFGQDAPYLDRVYVATSTVVRLPPEVVDVELNDALFLAHQALFWCRRMANLPAA